MVRAPKPHILVDCHCEVDSLLGNFPSAAEEVAAVLFVLSRAEFRLDEAAAELPFASALAQARNSDIHLNESQQSQLKDLQDDIAEGLSWDEAVEKCESILQRSPR